VQRRKGKRVESGAREKEGGEGRKVENKERGAEEGGGACSGS